VGRGNGEKIGAIQRVMIDRIGGKGAYAVLGFRRPVKFSVKRC
jgi:hypothetical protein